MKNIEALHRRNYLIMVLEGAFFMGGIGFFSNATVIPVFIDRFTGSKPLLGFVLTLFTLLMFLPRLLIGPHVPYLRNQTGYIMRIISIVRPLSFLPAILLFTGNAEAAVPAVICCIALVWAGNGCTTLVWSEVLATTIKSQWHGRLLGMQMLLGGLASIGAGAMVQVLLGNPAIPQETAFAWIFLLGAVLMVLSVVAMSFISNGNVTPRSGKASYRAYFQGLPAMIRQEKDNVFVLILQLVMSVSLMCLPFAILFAGETLGLSKSTTATLILVQSIGAPIGGWMWGQICDRLGSMKGLRLAALNTLLVAILPLGALAFRQAFALPVMVVFMLVGGISGGIWTAQYVYTMQVVRPKNRSASLVLSSIIMLPASFANTFAGQIAGNVGYVPLFILCGIIAAAGIAMSFYVRHPREVLRQREQSENAVQD